MVEVYSKAEEVNLVHILPDFFPDEPARYQDHNLCLKGCGAGAMAPAEAPANAIKTIIYAQTVKGTTVVGLEEEICSQNFT